VELLAVISEDTQALDMIRHNNLYQHLIAILNSPAAGVDGDLLEGAMMAIRNCLAPLPGAAVRTSAAKPRSGRADECDHEGDWFVHEFYQLHGLEPLVGKLLSDDADIQALALQISINYCKALINHDKIGELGGIEHMLKIFTSETSPAPLRSLALSAIRHSLKSCPANVDQLRKAGGVKVIVLYFKNEAPKTVPIAKDKEEDVFNALVILNVTLDIPGIEVIKEEQAIPLFVQYFMQEVNQDIKNLTVTLLKQLASNDPKCRKEMSEIIKRENRKGNAGIPPRRYNK